MPLDLVSTLSELVAIPSVNPMGRAISGPEYFEYRLTDYLEQLFARLGIPTWRQPIAEKRDNLLARLDGDPPLESGGTLVLLEAHQDTVPVDGMSIPPFDPQVRDGRLYGRGSCDIKGGMATMLAASGAPGRETPCPAPDGDHGLHGQRGTWIHRRHRVVRIVVGKVGEGKSEHAAPPRCGHRRGTDQSPRRRGAQRHDPLAMPHARPGGA